MVVSAIPALNSNCLLMPTYMSLFSCTVNTYTNCCSFDKVAAQQVFAAPRILGFVKLKNISVNNGKECNSNSLLCLCVNKFKTIVLNNVLSALFYLQKKVQAKPIPSPSLKFL